MVAKVSEPNTVRILKQTFLELVIMFVAILFYVAAGETKKCL